MKNDHMVQNPPYWRAKEYDRFQNIKNVNLDWSLNALESVLFFLPSSMVDFVPCDCKVFFGVIAF